MSAEVRAVEAHQQAQPRTPFAIRFDGTWESVNAWLSWLGHDEDGDDTSGGPAVGLQEGRLVLEFADDGERYVIEPGGWLINVAHGEWRPGVMLAPGFPSDVGSADLGAEEPAAPADDTAAPDEYEPMIAAVVQDADAAAASTGRTLAASTEWAATDTGAGPVVFDDTAATSENGDV